MHAPASPPGRAAALIAALQLQPHPEGGFYREIWRAPQRVATHDGRTERCALTSIDFLLQRGQFSAWHRVASDEVWHLLEGGPLRLWVMPPACDCVQRIELAPVSATGGPRHIVPASWWQAAEPLGEFAYSAATVGPGFEFADFSFLRDDPAALAALGRLDASLLRLR